VQQQLQISVSEFGLDVVIDIGCCLFVWLLQCLIQFLCVFVVCLFVVIVLHKLCLCCGACFTLKRV
jgi:hypothetical protein